jgi:uncharacterized protein (TIGR03435 family)
MLIRSFWLGLMGAAVGCCQIDTSTGGFEVAALHRVSPSERIPGISKEGGPGTRTPGSFVCRYCPLSMLIEIAYDLMPYQVLLSSSLDGEHYMLNARLAPGSSKEDFRVMMQQLLNDRFGFSSRMVSKKMAGHTLRVAKGGPKVRAVDPAPTRESAPQSDSALPEQRLALRNLKVGPDGFPIVPDGFGMSIVSANNSTRLKSPRETMVGLASILSHQISEPVVDATGLTGSYEVALTWRTDIAGSATSAEFSQWPPLEEALVSQLGLRLEKGTVTVPVLVADHVKRTPSIE